MTTRRRRGAGRQSRAAQAGPVRPPRRGFTLVEVLVALALMALLSALAWRGLDGMLRAREGTQAALDRTARLGTVLAQWEQDLRAVHDTLVVPALNFDGRTVRLTRRVDGGVQLVAWAVRGGVWQRWAGPVLTEAEALQQAWLRSQQLLGNEPGQLTVAERAEDLQLYFFRGNAWTNAQSSGDLAATIAPPPAPPAGPPKGGPGAPDASGGDPAAAGPSPGGAAPPPAPAAPAAGVAREVLPDGVRLVITLDGRRLTRDLALEAGG